MSAYTNKKLYELLYLYMIIFVGICTHFAYKYLQNHHIDINSRT